MYKLQADAGFAELKDDIDTTRSHLMAADTDIKEALTGVNKTVTQRVGKQRFFHIVQYTLKLVTKRVRKTFYLQTCLSILS